jgi:aminoglycoside 6'-N-acetyltransferase
MPQTSRADRIAFHAFDLEEALPNLLRWLGDPDVRPWYDEGELTPENLSARFAPDATTHCYTIAIDNQPVGYIQTYRIGDEPEYQRQVDVDPDAVATDLFIGESAYRNGGWGTEVLRVFLERIVFGKMGASLAMIAPDPANARAVRCYEKAGFHPVKTVHVVDEDHPGNTGDELVMLLNRPDHP